MSHASRARSFSWNTALAGIKADRAAVVPGLVLARSETIAEPVSTDPAVPTEDTFTPAPTDLADACLWAVRHRAWIDGQLKTSDWSDEKFDGESAKTNAVFARAINEPSATLRDITAKAALALEDFERFTLRPGHTPPDNASDRAERLAALAALTIHNDDPAETAAFARDLGSFATAIARPHEEALAAPDPETPPTEPEPVTVPENRTGRPCYASCNAGSPFTSKSGRCCRASQNRRMSKRFASS